MIPHIIQHFFVIVIVIAYHVLFEVLFQFFKNNSAIGENTWLFSNTQNGAQASALIYSLAVTACANGLNVEDYFYWLLTSNMPVLSWND